VFCTYGRLVTDNETMAYLDWREPVRLLREWQGPPTPAQTALAAHLGAALSSTEPRTRSGPFGRPASDRLRTRYSR